MWNHQPHGCLLNLLFRRWSKKTSKLPVTGLCMGNIPGPVNSPPKGPVTRKMFPFDDVIMTLNDSCFLIGLPMLWNYDLANLLQEQRQHSILMQTSRCWNWDLLACINHYCDVIMTTIASQITSLTIVYSAVYSGADQWKYQSSPSLAFVWGIHRDRWIPRTNGQ